MFYLILLRVLYDCSDHGVQSLSTGRGQMDRKCQFREDLRDIQITDFRRRFS